jgi:hypothetical protein
MRPSLRFSRGSLALGFPLGFVASGAAAAAEPAWRDPVIQGYGKVQPLPEAAVQSSPNREYKILFSITKAAQSPDRINPGLEHVARLINIFGIAKVPPEKRKNAAVIHGSAKIQC